MQPMTRIVNAANFRPWKVLLNVLVIFGLNVIGFRTTEEKCRPRKSCRGGIIRKPADIPPFAGGGGGGGGGAILHFHGLRPLTNNSNNSLLL